MPSTCKYVDGSVFTGYMREKWYFLIDKSKTDIYFHNLLGIKWHMQTGGNAVPAGRVIKVVAARLSWTALWLFKMKFTSPWTWTLIFARTMRFSTHTEDWELTLVQISQRCRLTWHEHDQWKMTPPSWSVSSVRKAVRRTELSSFRSVQCTFVDGIKSFFVAYMGVILTLN